MQMEHNRHEKKTITRDSQHAIRHNKVKIGVGYSLWPLNRRMEVGTKLKEALFVLSRRDLHLHLEGNGVLR